MSNSEIIEEILISAYYSGVIFEVFEISETLIRKGLDRTESFELAYHKATTSSSDINGDLF